MMFGSGAWNYLFKLPHGRTDVFVQHIRIIRVMVLFNKFSETADIFDSLLRAFKLKNAKIRYFALYKHLTLKKKMKCNIKEIPETSVIQT